ncbi:DUF3618 domain-containing protein [Actinoplanes sp. NPDC048796]|uniref:DUF3618 domain-containing protein n=1 Tax=unclassified Actinoplanes TaxID=2626549 RepID=UPI0033C96608
MAEEPDRLRQDIENTRRSLTRDVDLLAEKTSPTKVAQRRWTAVKEKVMGVSDSASSKASDVGGTVSDKASQVGGAVSDKASQVGSAVSDKAGQAGDVASEKAHQAVGAVKQAPQAVAQQTQGNPIAAGIIAFGVGMLAATLIPVTEAEKSAGAALKEHSGDLTEKVKDATQELREDLQGSAQEALGQVKETAQDAVATTKSTAQDNVQDVRDQARSAAS